MSHERWLCWQWEGDCVQKSLWGGEEQLNSRTQQALQKSLFAICMEGEYHVLMKPQ